MSKNESKVGKLESTEAKATTAPRAYEAPELVLLGQAHTLVQGGDVVKLYHESNGLWRDDD